MIYNDADFKRIAVFYGSSTGPERDIVKAFFDANDCGGRHYIVTMYHSNTESPNQVLVTAHELINKLPDLVVVVGLQHANCIITELKRKNMNTPIIVVDTGELLIDGKVQQFAHLPHVISGIELPPPAPGPYLDVVKKITPEAQVIGVPSTKHTPSSVFTRTYDLFVHEAEKRGFTVIPGVIDNMKPVTTILDDLQELFSDVDIFCLLEHSGMLREHMLLSAHAKQFNQRIYTTWREAAFLFDINGYGCQRTELGEIAYRVAHKLLHHNQKIGSFSIPKITTIRKPLGPTLDFDY